MYTVYNINEGESFMKQKKVCSGLLIIMLCLTTLFFCPELAKASTVASGQCGDSVTYSLDGNGCLTISGTGAMWDLKCDNSISSCGGDVECPWDSYRSQITSVVFGDGVTDVSVDVFYGYENLFYKKMI